MIKASPLFLTSLQKHGENSVFSAPAPSTTKEYETGVEYLDPDQNKFFSELEIWILKNEKLIVSFLKAKHAEELDAAQEKFNFVKNL